MSKIVISNLKNYLDNSNIDEYINEMDKININNCDLIICPSFLHMYKFKNKKYKIGAQNIFSSNNICTGEILINQLKEFDVKYVILGHQERRLYLNESNKEINSKINLCLNENMKVILCIGEQKEESNKFTVLKNQLEEALIDVSIDKLENIIISYEPLYNIGKNNKLNIENIESAITYIKKLIKEKYDFNINVIYGGSVNLSNISEILNICDGVIIGKLSSNYIEFIKILEKIN